MDHKPQNDLDALERALKELPDWQAPATLIPRVQSLLAARARRHWWQRPWTAWPVIWKFAFLGLLILIPVAAHWGLLWAAQPLESLNLAGRLTQAWSWWTALEAVLAAFGHALLLLGKQLGLLWLGAIAALVSFMYGSCIALGSLCFRLACRTRLN